MWNISFSFPFHFYHFGFYFSDCVCHDWKINKKVITIILLLGLEGRRNRSVPLNENISHSCSHLWLTSCQLYLSDSEVISMAVTTSLRDLMTKDLQALIFEVKYLFLGGARKLLVWQLKYISERNLWYKDFLNVESFSCFWRLSVSGLSRLLYWN